MSDYEPWEPPTPEERFRRATHELLMLIDEGYGIGTVSVCGEDDRIRLLANVVLFSENLPCKTSRNANNGIACNNMNLLENA